MNSTIQNASNPKQVKRAEEAMELRRKRELDDIREVMATASGRRFMWRLINNICHYDTDDAKHSGSDTYKSLGERNVGRQIKNDLYLASYDRYQEMERENWALLKGEK
jgi:hypothetical protein